MLHKPSLSLLLALGLTLCLSSCSQSDSTVDIVLSDSGITVDGAAASADPGQRVYTGAEIVYYQDGTDETYGEGSQEEMHTPQEAAAHTVVTITQPGTYRLSGSLSQGQIAIDLGEGAEEDPEAVVTLILDNANVTCTVAPALIFYQVYECGSTDQETAGPEADTSAAGANVVLAAGSENRFTGSHVARIYKEGTTDKLHKYDGAFYSKASMNIFGDDGDDSGSLHIIGDNEGLDSELHLTIHGGTIRIDSQDDGINTNEDYVSVTTIRGGDLTICAGQGAEGDGIDSNGYLTIYGGTIRTSSNPQSPDGGIDADCAITIHGGTLSAFGTRNDAVDTSSPCPYMELSFASALPAGSRVRVTDTQGTEVWSAETQQICQSITLTTPDLALDTEYNVWVDDVLQCYSSSGMMGGGMGGQPPEMPEDFDPAQMEDGQRPEMPEGAVPAQDTGGQPPEMPEDFDPAQRENGQKPQGGQGPGAGGQTADGSGSTQFLLTETTRAFSGVCDSDASGKTRVTFAVEGSQGFGPSAVLPAVTAITATPEIDPALVQITVTDSPSEDYAESCLLSDGLDAVNALLPQEPGSYTLTVAVLSGTEGFTGAAQLSFTPPDTETP